MHRVGSGAEDHATQHLCGVSRERPRELPDHQQNVRNPTCNIDSGKAQHTPTARWLALALLSPASPIGPRTVLGRALNGRTRHRLRCLSAVVQWPIPPNAIILPAPDQDQLPGVVEHAINPEIVYSADVEKVFPSCDRRADADHSVCHIGTVACQVRSPRAWCVGRRAERVCGVLGNGACTARPAAERDLVRSARWADDHSGDLPVDRP